MSVFETDRLRARSWTLDDVEAAHAMYSDSEVVRYIGLAPVRAPAGWIPLPAKLGCLEAACRSSPVILLPGQHDGGWRRSARWRLWRWWRWARVWGWQRGRYWR